MTTKDDEIIAEIRAYREAHAASFGFDLARIVEDIRRRQRESGRRVVTRSPRKPVVDAGQKPDG
ncbi:MAG: hypothetical protein HY719_03625 [Planctomycetes bacterium]|nr:hypothetical protein [Planctomycetota bacterium]